MWVLVGVDAVAGGCSRWWMTAVTSIVLSPVDAVAA